MARQDQIDQDIERMGRSYPGMGAQFSELPMPNSKEERITRLLTVIDERLKPSASDPSAESDADGSHSA
jgi:hypothetical protein